jgi:hypothetical protein
MAQNFVALSGCAETLTLATLRALSPVGLAAYIQEN